MKVKFFGLTAVLTLCGLSAFAQSEADKTFANLKSLAGDWGGKNSRGESVQVSSGRTAGGSAIMSEIRSEMKGHSQEMISMIHMDRDRLLLTHSCAAGNQPRMQASTSPDGKTINFDCIDATNLARRDAGQIERVIITIRDGSHHSEDWHFLDHGREIVEKFDLERKS